MPPPDGDVHRFSRTVRWVHAAVGGLVLVLVATAAVLYNASLAELVGRRGLVRTVHVWCGLALPVPLLAGLVARSYRDDLGRLNRFPRRDWRWLRSRTRRDGTIRVGKFNAGQKLGAALSGGGLGVLLLTGVVMHYPGLTGVTQRTGATLLHDWAALALGLLVVGHVAHALRDAAAMRGIRTGCVPLRWARREHAAWADEVAGPSG
jgi:formate dehydrogenase subunit gamma